MTSFNQLKKNLKKDFSSFKTTKVALLGDTSTQFLNVALRGFAFEKSLHLDVWEADFDQIDLQISDPTSELYEFEPEVVIIYQSSHKLLQRYNKSKEEKRANLANIELEKLQHYLSNLASHTQAKVVVYNYAEIDDTVFGNFANKLEWSYLYQLRKLNYLLMDYASTNPNLFIADLSSVQNLLGKSNMFQPSVYINTEMVLSLESLPYVAARTLDILLAFTGRMNKCLILDLDNTTWGGIIGDDGIENIQIGSLGIGKAFTELQYWAKKLKERGIILAICSKNTESVAKEPFEKHPDMVIRLDDISVFVANWENKADNIRQIQAILNIGFDSMVFLDDNPFERNLVRQNLPQVCVPELPEDPSEYLEYIYSLNLFETLSFSNEDKERTKLYQVEAQRASVQMKFTNEDDFLSSLEMVSAVEPFNKFNRPRVSQLSQRSNQFNLRTVRYTEEDIERMSNQEGHYTFSFGLEDKFGDNGLICVIILEKKSDQEVFIDTWFMSCRVLKRGMENFVLNTIMTFAKENGFDTVVGEYIPTAKNQMVAGHYESLGFTAHESVWHLDATNYEPRKTFIQIK
ncbi:MAG: hypothetical protein CFE24_03700 [Flavobacterium sp. BFFFF2]|nr:MAG: hypothetical protein CFE24_03700 [Flavobacterium sp. BFFFF2]